MNDRTPASCAQTGSPAAPKNGKCGFSLIETVVACTIVLIAMGGCFLVLEASMNLLRATRDGYAATTITNARLERARMLTYTALTGLVETNTLVDDYGLPSSLGRFRRATSIAVNQPVTNCTQITVTTDVQKPGKAPGTIYYNAKTMTGVFPQTFAY